MLIFYFHLAEFEVLHVPNLLKDNICCDVEDHQT